MAQRLHLPHRRTSDPARTEDSPHLGDRVYVVQRAGAVVLALFLLLFALMGFASDQPFISTRGEPVLGMSSNGLLSTLSVVVALVLLVAAARGARTASTVMVVLGPLFLLSAGVHAVVLGTQLNWLAFSVSNVLFSVVVGLLLLLLGAYGRIGGHLPPDSPYAHPAPGGVDYVEDLPWTPEEVAAEEAMREAEVAVVQHVATPEQCRRVQAMARVHGRAARRRLWMELESTAQHPADGHGALRDGASAGRADPPSSPRRGRRLPWHRAGTRPG